MVQKKTKKTLPTNKKARKTQTQPKKTQKEKTKSVLRKASAPKRVCHISKTSGKDSSVRRKINKKLKKTAISSQSGKRTNDHVQAHVANPKNKRVYLATVSRSENSQRCGCFRPKNKVVDLQRKMTKYEKIQK
eukprot:c20620_g2_i1.p1 GENE.c20620_g2_i1~~c20620_g2_i1.p1  ORF type:complete len:140 (+),score=30.90 c20620_g2_i1:22-420(+)